MKFIKAIPREYFEAEFLRAEFFKNTFNNVRKDYEKIVFSKNVTNERYNEIRHILLQIERGAILDTFSKTKWQLAEVTVGELLNFNVIKAKSWCNVFGCKRTIKHIASRYSEGIDDKNHVPKIKEIEDAYLKEKKPFFKTFTHKPIIITIPNHPPMILEGNHRLVSMAYCLNIHDNFPFSLKETDKVKIIVGDVSYIEGIEDFFSLTFSK